MSRGPGRVQQAIEAAFSRFPTETFTVEDLGPVAYPGVNRVEKKHRVAILRAAYAALDRTGWDTLRSESPGSHVVFFNPVNLRSYGLARLRADMWGYRTPIVEIVECLEDPRRDYVELLSRGGAWWLHVQLAIARRDGNADATKELQQQVDEITAHAFATMAAIDRQLV